MADDSNTCTCIVCYACQWWANVNSFVTSIPPSSILSPVRIGPSQSTHYRPLAHTASAWITTYITRRVTYTAPNNFSEGSSSQKVKYKNNLSKLLQLVIRLTSCSNLTTCTVASVAWPFRRAECCGIVWHSTMLLPVYQTPDIWRQRSLPNCNGVTPNKGAKFRWGRFESAIFDHYLAISQKRCKIGT